MPLLVTDTDTQTQLMLGICQDVFFIHVSLFC